MLLLGQDVNYRPEILTAALLQAGGLGGYVE